MNNKNNEIQKNYGFIYKKLAQRAKVFIQNYFKKNSKKKVYTSWLYLKEELYEYYYDFYFGIDIKNIPLFLKNKLLSENKEELNFILNRLISYLQTNYSSIEKMKQWKKEYNKKYYKDQKKIKGIETMTGREIALKTAKMKRDKSSSLVLNAIKQLEENNTKVTIKNILIVIDNQLSKAQVSRYLKEFRINS